MLLEKHETKVPGLSCFSFDPARLSKFVEEESSEEKFFSAEVRALQSVGMHMLDKIVTKVKKDEELKG
jgi:hypothetical protein